MTRPLHTMIDVQAKYTVTQVHVERRPAGGAVGILGTVGQMPFRVLLFPVPRFQFPVSSIHIPNHFPLAPILALLAVLKDLSRVPTHFCHHDRCCYSNTDRGRKEKTVPMIERVIDMASIMYIEILLSCEIALPKSLK